MPYDITKYSFDQAKRLGVHIQSSTLKNYKIDVFKDGEYITSVGDKRYSDFPTYAQEKGIDYARTRQKLYWARHHNDSGARGYYAKVLLW